MVPEWKREQTGRDFFGLFLKHMQDMEKNPEWKAEFEARGGGGQEKEEEKAV